MLVSAFYLGKSIPGITCTDGTSIGNFLKAGKLCKGLTFLFLS